MGLRRRGEQPATPAFGRGFSTLSSMSEGKELLFSPSAAPAGGMKLPPFARTFDRALPTPGQGPEGGMSFPQPAGLSFPPPGGMSLPPLGGMSLPPHGGMSLPSYEESPEVSPQRASRPALSLGSRSFERGDGSSVVHQTIEHTSQVPLHELPLSREVKSPSYPNGPICIYSPNVYLYHQPTCDEAREFDVTRHSHHGRHAIMRPHSRRGRRYPKVHRLRARRIRRRGSLEKQSRLGLCLLCAHRVRTCEHRRLLGVVRRAMLTREAAIAPSDAGRTWIQRLWDSTAALMGGHGRVDDLRVCA